MFARYHKWAAWRQGIIKDAERQKWLRNPFGKWAPFLRPHASKAVNFMPQSGAACCLWYSLPLVEKAIAPFGGMLYNTVHDEITVQAPIGKESEVSQAAKMVMEYSWPQLGGLVVPVKVKMGSNWGTMS
jgi:DNA polymerase I-like protein with 3'-5' exonuclease and polymerase domains